ncbi:hypothetical protein QWZ10_07420 [Paracoccus cavernae]|uniref:Uncharacterized protein n=1 Tax=Paracoccus cavernae TaxID=1571207 RepID=A0ABT8D5Z9_9RHOB|nr:hypothetical protein [Paracoccus cavernae]
MLDENAGVNMVPAGALTLPVKGCVWFTMAFIPATMPSISASMRVASIVMSLSRSMTHFSHFRVCF